MEQTVSQVAIGRLLWTRYRLSESSIGQSMYLNKDTWTAYCG